MSSHPPPAAIVGGNTSLSFSLSLRSGSTSGSASPSTRYGSFPPSTSNTTTAVATTLTLTSSTGSSSISSNSNSNSNYANGLGTEINDRLLRAAFLADSAASSSSDRKGKGRGSDVERGIRRTTGNTPRRANDPSRRLWTRSTETLLLRSSDSPHLFNDDHQGPGAGEGDAMDGIGYRDSTTLTPEEEEAEEEMGRRRGRRRSSVSIKTTPAKGEEESGRGGSEKQYGVMKMEMISRYGTKKGLWSIFAGVYLISTLTSLENNTTPTIEPYFLSMLSAHTYLSGMSIAVSIAYAVAAAPLSKILDVFGRSEALLLSLSLYGLAYTLTSLSRSPLTFLLSRSLSAFASQGIQLAQQVVIADLTNLEDRGLLTSTISLPWLITSFIGPVLGGWFQSGGEPGYRAVYACFAVGTPLAGVVLVRSLAKEWQRVKSRFLAPSTAAARTMQTVAATTTTSIVAGGVGGMKEDDTRSFEEEHIDGRAWIDKRREREMAREREIREETNWARASFGSSAKRVWTELDVVGLITLTVGCSCVLLPLTAAAVTPRESTSLNILIVIGLACLGYFLYYESRLSVLPMLPTRLISNRTIIAGSLLGFFHYASQYIYGSFFTSFLQLARGYSPRDASYISQSYLFSASVSALAAGFLTKYTRRYKWVGLLGVIVHFLGIALMLHARGGLLSTSERTGGAEGGGANIGLWASQMIAGVGGGFTTIAAQLGVQGVVGRQDVGVATAIFLLITQIGGAAGGSLAGSIWSTLLPSRLRLYLPTPISEPLIERIMSSLPYAMSFEHGTPVRVAIELAYIDVQRVLDRWALAMILPCLIAILCMKDLDLGKVGESVLGNGALSEGVVVLGHAVAIADDDSEGSARSETSSLLNHR